MIPIENTERGKIYTLKELREKPISNQIINLKPRDRNLELRVIVLEHVETREIKSKNDTLYQYLIADGTASMYANFFGEIGRELKEGDILYVYDVYTTLFHKKMILYQGTKAFVTKIGEYFYKWKENPNVSLQDWSAYEDLTKKQ